MNNAKLMNANKGFDGAGLVERLDQLQRTLAEVITILQTRLPQAAEDHDQAEQSIGTLSEAIEAGQQRTKDSRSRPKPNEPKERP